MKRRNFHVISSLRLHLESCGTQQEKPYKQKLLSTFKIMSWIDIKVVIHSRSYISRSIQAASLFQLRGYIYLQGIV